MYIEMKIQIRTHSVSHKYSFLSVYSQNFNILFMVFLKKAVNLFKGSWKKVLVISRVNYSLERISRSFNYFFTSPNIFSIGENSGVLLGVSSISAF